MRRERCAHKTAWQELLNLWGDNLSSKKKKKKKVQRTLSLPNGQNNEQSRGEMWNKSQMTWNKSKVGEALTGTIWVYNQQCIISRHFFVSNLNRWLYAFLPQYNLITKPTHYSWHPLFKKKKKLNKNLNISTGAHILSKWNYAAFSPTAVRYWALAVEKGGTSRLHKIILWDITTQRGIRVL